MRHTGKQPEKETTLSPPEKVQRTTDYWIREERHWKRVHVIPRTEFYVPTPEDTGPDINKFLPTRYTNIHSEHNIRRIEDEHWTGSTSFEESMEYSDHWRRYTSNGNTSKGNDNANAIDTTGNTGTQHHTHSAYKQKAGKQITRSRHRGSQSYKLISPTSPVPVTSFTHRYLQKSTYKQAWQWQQWLQASTISSATRRPFYKHSFWSVAEQKAFYKATRRSTW